MILHLHFDTNMNNFSNQNLSDWKFMLIYETPAFEIEIILILKNFFLNFDFKNGCKK